VRARLGCLVPTYEPPFCENPAVPPIVWRIRRVEQPIREKRFLPAGVFRVLGAAGAGFEQPLMPRVTPFPGTR
jgi:hypothetical protein